MGPCHLGCPLYLQNFCVVHMLAFEELVEELVSQALFVTSGVPLKLIRPMSVDI